MREWDYSLCRWRGGSCAFQQWKRTRAQPNLRKRNLEAAGLNNVEVVNLGVAEWMKNSRPFEPLDFLLLDPPRVGCENAAIAGILALRPRRLTYVSCDPATLARDLRKFIDDDYVLDSIVAFDMFPQTHHVETVARLTAKRQL